VKGHVGRKNMTTINRNDLIEALLKVKPGIANKEFLEQSSHFILNEEEIISYNDEVSISCPFTTKMKCTVDAGLFFKLIDKMEGDDLNLKLEDKKLKIECGSVKAELIIVENSNIFPYTEKLIDEQNELEWEKVPSDFIHAIKMCLFSASSDKTLGTLTCIWFEDDSIFSTDRYRMSWYKLNGNLNKKFYIEAEFLKGLLNVESDILEFALGKSWCHFSMTDDTIYSVRLIVPESTLSIKEKFEQFQPALETALSDDFLKAVETVSLISQNVEEQSQYVEIEFSKDNILVYSESEKGTIQKTVKSIFNTKTPFSISVSPTYLCQALSNIGSGTVALNINSDKGIMVLTSEYEINFKHMLALKVS